MDGLDVMRILLIARFARETREGAIARSRQEDVLLEAKLQTSIIKFR